MWKMRQERLTVFLHPEILNRNTEKFSGLKSDSFPEFNFFSFSLLLIISTVGTVFEGIGKPFLDLSAYSP